MLSARPPSPAVVSAFPGRSSEPITRTVLPVRRVPPGDSASSALSETPLVVWALMKNSTADRITQPTITARTPVITLRRVLQPRLAGSRRRPSRLGRESRPSRSLGRSLASGPLRER